MLHKIENNIGGVVQNILPPFLNRSKPFRAQNLIFQSFVFQKYNGKVPTTKAIKQKSVNKKHNNAIIVFAFHFLLVPIITSLSL